MPQLDVSTYSSQLFWLFFCFSILYLYVSMVTVPRIESLLELRWQNVEGNHLRATESKKEADTLREEFEKTLGDAKQNANDTTMKSLQEMNLETAHRKKDISDEVLARIKTAETKILDTQQQASNELKTAATELTHTLINHLIATKLDDAPVKKAVEATLNAESL